jgi:hypothetical protein
MTVRFYGSAGNEKTAHKGGRNVTENLVLLPKLSTRRRRRRVQTHRAHQIGLPVFNSVSEALQAGYEFYDEGPGGYLFKTEGHSNSFALVLRPRPQP